MKKITLFLIGVLLYTLGQAQVTIRDYTFPDASSVVTGAMVGDPGTILATTPATNTFIDLLPLADGTNGEATFAYNATGNPTGAIEFSGINTQDGIGRNYLHRINDTSIDYQGASNFEVSFDIRRVGDLIGTAVNVQVQIPQQGGGVIPVNQFNIETQPGFGESYINVTIPINEANFDNSSSNLIIDISLGAGAFVGAGGTILVDNITVSIPDPTCDDGVQNGDETGVDCGGPDCPPCETNVDINFDATSAWGGFMNVSNLPSPYGDGVFQFGAGWGVPDLVALLDTNNNTVELKPNRIGDPDPYWQTGDLTGNKIMDANLVIGDNSLRGKQVTFSGNVQSNTLNNTGLYAGLDFDVTAFIKVFNADFSVLEEVQTVDLRAVARGSGDFSVVLDATGYNTDQNIQYGFEFIGPNIGLDSMFNTDYDNLGSIIVGPPSLSSSEFTQLDDIKAYPNPSNSNWNIKSNSTISSVELFDALGRNVLIVNSNDLETTINAENLPKGLYFATVSNEVGVSTIKLIRD